MQLYLDPPASGAWNMAVDEAMLNAAAERGVRALRFYGWREPTLSLGYFQGHASRSTHMASLQCPLVRRLSGGGAIVHDRELTYSLALPVGESKAAAADLYSLMHSTLIEALDRMGVKSTYPVETNDTSFLCFQRRSAGDVVVDGVKIAGSAQRRRGRAVLQHGSVLLARSAAAPELLGIAEVGRVLSRTEVESCWIDQLAMHGLKPEADSPLPGWVAEQAATLLHEKYESPVWNLRR